MKIKSILVILISLMLMGCWFNNKQIQLTPEKSEKYYELLKVNNDLTFSGANELTENDIADKEYYHFIYEKGLLKKIISHSSITVSFHELNKYIFNVNKEWKEINITHAENSKEYTFNNKVELIKFNIQYDSNGLPTSFQVLPFNIDYDSFNILGRSMVYSGKTFYNKENLLEKITWIGSNAEYRYGYDKKNIRNKQIYKDNETTFEYKFVLSRYGTIQSIK